MSIPEPQQPASTEGASQGPDRPVKIALVLYPRFTGLDIIGPFQVLAGVPGHDTVFVAADAGPVIDGTGRCPLTTTATLAELTAPDAVVIGGSLSEEDPDEQWCNGCARSTPPLPGRPRVHRFDLPGRRRDPGRAKASTHWARAEQLGRRRARYTEQRVAERGKVITAAGVPVGIDMALTLLARIHGPQLAQMVQLAVEYDPCPPLDGGSPSKAPAQMAGLELADD